MDSGKLIEKGTHSELLKLKGKYISLFINIQGNSL